MTYSLVGCQEEVPGVSERWGSDGSIRLVYNFRGQGVGVTANLRLIPFRRDSLESSSAPSPLPTACLAGIDGDHQPVDGGRSLRWAPMAAQVASRDLARLAGYSAVGRPAPLRLHEMLLFIECFTLACFLVCLAHALALRGREGAWLFGSLLFLGLLRENFVTLYRLLYEFAPLTLQLGLAPLIGSIIWGYSIYLCIVWVEAVTGEPLSARRPSSRFLALAALFMMALAAFYEPFLKLIGMARWEEGTWFVLDVPPIALIGYSSLTVLFLLTWSWSLRWPVQGARRVPCLAGALVPLALGHAAGLQALKTWLGW